MAPSVLAGFHSQPIRSSHHRCLSIGQHRRLVFIIAACFVPHPLCGKHGSWISASPDDSVTSRLTDRLFSRQSN